MSLCLTEAEIRDLTHKKRASAQMRALKARGIDCWLRPDNTVAVDREVYRRAIGAVTTAARAPRMRMNMRAING